MKIIQVSDEDYEILMELSKEYQTQENDGNAFPYFWEPGSYKDVINIHGEGEIVKVHQDGETYDLESFAEYDDYEEYNKFLDSYFAEDFFPNKYEYHKDIESEWISYIEDDTDADVLTFDLEHQTENNPSIFKSDVKQFINGNKHHLGERPGTYARTFFRMSKMEKLIKCLMNLNKIPIEEVTQEARRHREDVKI